MKNIKNIEFNSVKICALHCLGILITLMGPILQPVVRPTADPGVASLIPARSYTFVEIDHAMISIFIHLLLIQEELLSVKKLQAKVCARSTG